MKERAQTENPKSKIQSKTHTHARQAPDLSRFHFTSRQRKGREQTALSKVFRAQYIINLFTFPDGHLPTHITSSRARSYHPMSRSLSLH